MRISPSITLASALALAASLLGAGPAAAGEYIKGIDVSNHQGEIRWDEVPDRIEFAFVKASEGRGSRGFIDPWYGRNRALAKEQGLMVGAYHFARPGGATRKKARRDARREARFFQAAATPEAGELLPALDLEVTGGLPEGRLIRWTRTYLRALGRLIPEEPMIYTSPSFWRTKMGNTDWFATHGYEVLWIAHWKTKRPDVPANNWSGHGWTFWQYTDNGSVLGIDGPVDMNKYRGTDFASVMLGDSGVDPGAEPPG
jgi:lysozyme